MFTGKNFRPSTCVLILQASGIQMYYMCLYNSSETKGNPLQTIMAFALVESIGVFASSQLVKVMSIPKAINLYIFLILAVNFMIKFYGFDENGVLLLFFALSFFLGALYNTFMFV